MKMSVLTKRRIETFKNNKRAYISAIIFVSVFIISLFSEFVANDKPIFLKIDVHSENSTETKYFFPIFEPIIETEIGGELPLLTDFHDPYIKDLIEENGFAIWPLIKYSYGTISSNPEVTFPSKPSVENWLGTDDHGRDIFARILYGFRLSVLFGMCLCFFGSSIGMLAGLLQGYYGGKLDLIFQRFMELWSGVPVLYLIIILSSVMIINFWALLGIMLLFSWMGLVEVVRAESLRARNMEFVRAAHALGVSNTNIMLRHILPNAVVALIAVMPFQLNASIITLTSLDFLGFGLPSHYPSLGELIAQGKNNLYAPWIAISGFITLGGMLTCLVLIGEGVRDAFDPRVFLHYNSDENANLEEEK